MKRKSGRKSSKREDESSNGVEDKSEQNGDTSDHEENEAPKDKKRKSSKSSRKSVSFISKREETTFESEKSDQENDEDQKEEKKSQKSGRKLSKKDEKKYDSEESLDSEEQIEENEKEKKKSSKKKRKSSTKEEKKEEKEPEESDEDEDDESQYEVEAVLDEKMIKGVRHYLIRWKGYEEESDTWEPEGTLDCERLIQEFKERKKNKGKKWHKKEKKDSKTADWDENEDFEVDRILEVHHRRDGKREFLVSWKGYSAADNSWEPEENMDCKDLIAKFMAKVDRAKQVDERELRVKRTHVQRYTLSTQDTGRRLSKRFRGKERVQYHDAE